MYNSKRLKPPKCSLTGIHIIEYNETINNEEENYVLVCKDIQNTTVYLLHKVGRIKYTKNIYIIVCIDIYLNVYIYMCQNDIFKEQTKRNKFKSH